jgi:hypothetical protein
MEKLSTKSTLFKSLCLIILFTGFSINTYSQAPDGINYQAVVRDGKGALVKSQLVNIKFTISEGTTTIYSEEHTSVSTSAQGLVNLVIGEGTAQTGTFADVNWSDGLQENLEVEIDLGSGYVSVGTQDFESVPYALNNPWEVQSGGELTYIDTMNNSERIKIETNIDLNFGNDLISVSIPTTSSDDAQYMEFERGSSPVARINSDGSAEFDHVELTDTAGPTNAPTEGTMYADNAPMAWGFIAGNILGASISNDFGIASVTRNAAGDYTITLDNSWDDNPAIIVTPITAAGDAEIPGVVTSASNNSFDVNIRDGANPSTLTDSNFMVVVFGRPQ